MTNKPTTLAESLVAAATPTPDKDSVATVNIKLPTNKFGETDIGMERTVFSCTCWTPEHHFFVVQDRHDDDLYFQVRLNSDLPWWVRLKLAVKFFLGMGDAGYTEICLSKEDRVKLGEVLKVKRVIKLNPTRMKTLAGIKDEKKVSK